jgi:Uma2 family endonuclease
MATTQSIPKSLIYEISNGKPIYYKNYKQVLRGECSIDEIMGCSALQSLIIAVLLEFLYKNYDATMYRILTNEMGIKGKNLLRAADIAIYEREQLKGYHFGNKYITIPPKIVIEIDVKADTKNFDTQLDYYHKKTQELLDFGVETVIWITTQSQKMMVATQNNAWITYEWTHEIAILPNCTTSILSLLEGEEF